MDRLLIHRDQEPSRPIWNWVKIKQTYTFHLECYQHIILFQAPMWRERQEALQWTRWKAVERERQSTALILLVGGVVEGFVPKNRGQKVDIIGHFGEAVFAAPKWRGGSQNNVQPLVSPWSWDYTLLLPEDTGAVWRSFIHTCWVRPMAFTYKLQGSAWINIPWLCQC